MSHLQWCAPVTIEDDVWIGANCQILKGVTIGVRSVMNVDGWNFKDINRKGVYGYWDKEKGSCLSN